MYCTECNLKSFSRYVHGVSIVIRRDNDRLNAFTSTIVIIQINFHFDNDLDNFKVTALVPFQTFETIYPIMQMIMHSYHVVAFACFVLKFL